MATYQILYLIGIPLIIAAEYRFARNKLFQDRYDRWFSNLSLGFINEAVLLASPVMIPLLLLPESHSSTLHPLLAALVAFLVLDLAGYWLHRAYHHFRATWRLHRVHHCELELDFSTTFRHHPGEVIISLLVIYLVMATLALTPAQVIPYMVAVRAAQLLAHSNIRLNARAEALINLLFVTPGTHQFHHSRHQPQTDSNFGEVLTVWDRMFGTYTCPGSCPAPASFGLEEFSEVRDQRLGSLLLLPLR
ncbi:sterol desaturase family protein [Marinobacter orientalis]|uniref:Sterol desaturase family protein n=1 Tax=Marinobacter orientalis TaxID=1928859 RepID=A0A7Y0RF71_9GAMM|nr:sterol desaturase family protein [Marinobacter orientalis]NMT65105.1 sterol desaturase family protein [Marinobacter orientalis]TGX48948.1 sterol desaturase family protein [Marinobacter orientalis]